MSNTKNERNMIMLSALSDNFHSVVIKKDIRRFFFLVQEQHCLWLRKTLVQPVCHEKPSVSTRLKVETAVWLQKQNDVLLKRSVTWHRKASRKFCDLERLVVEGARCIVLTLVMTFLVCPYRFALRHQCGLTVPQIRTLVPKVEHQTFSDGIRAELRFQVKRIFFPFQ